MSDRWRAVVAALVNPELRAALAELNAAELTDNRRERAFARLADIGLVAERADGERVFDEAFVRSILNENPAVKRTGPDRFLDRAGRIDRYPVQHGDRHELLAWVAERAFSADEVFTESEVNERLEPFAPGGDVAVLRRYLVDHELLERTPSGSEYALVSGV
ncbi:hypothetical protein GCM10009775_24200 [Microbacterium aoyamense]|uniref:DUF2087 domain-containing protein n=1 Tax=Microbacterium aoyamense TaxID=344166 RepID=A0ABP5B621_9MICO|nr:DUF2087 domain-containing protein [Microbacterium aoyamense]